MRSSGYGPWPREVEPVSTVGSGDVLLAAFLAARDADKPIDEALRSAVAAGAASTLEVGAGRFDPREASRLAGGVEVTELEPVVVLRLVRSTAT